MQPVEQPQPSREGQLVILQKVGSPLNPNLPGMCNHSRIKIAGLGRWGQKPFGIRKKSNCTSPLPSPDGSAKPNKKPAQFGVDLMQTMGVAGNLGCVRQASSPVEARRLQSVPSAPCSCRPPIAHLRRGGLLNWGHSVWSGQFVLLARQRSLQRQLGNVTHGLAKDSWLARPVNYSRNGLQDRYSVWNVGSAGRIPKWTSLCNLEWNKESDRHVLHSLPVVLRSLLCVSEERSSEDTKHWGLSVDRNV